MALRIFQTSCCHQVSACAVPGQDDLCRVYAQFLSMVERIGNDAVRLFHCRRERCFRRDAIIHVPDQRVQPLHDGAAITAVTIRAALDKTAAVEIEHEGCFGRQPIGPLLIDMDRAPALYRDVDLCLRTGQGCQFLRADGAEAISAADGLRHSDFFFQCHPKSLLLLHQNAGNTVMV